MTKAVVKKSNTDVSTVFSDEDVALIKNTVAKGCSDSEFKLFMYTAMKYELDPLAKQVWCITNNSMSGEVRMD